MTQVRKQYEEIFAVLDRAKEQGLKVSDIIAEVTELAAVSVRSSNSIIKDSAGNTVAVLDMFYKRWVAVANNAAGADFGDYGHTLELDKDGDFIARTAQASTAIKEQSKVKMTLNSEISKHAILYAESAGESVEALDDFNEARASKAIISNKDYVPSCSIVDSTFATKTEAEEFLASRVNLL